MLDFHNALSSIRAQPIFRPPSISPSTPFLAHPFLPPVLLRSQCSLYIRPLRTHCYQLVRLNPLRLYSLTDCRSIYPDYPAAPARVFAARSCFPGSLLIFSRSFGP